MCLFGVCVCVCVCMCSASHCARCVVLFEVREFQFLPARDPGPDSGPSRGCTGWGKDRVVRGTWSIEIILVADIVIFYRFSRNMDCGLQSTESLKWQHKTHAACILSYVLHILSNRSENQVVTEKGNGVIKSCSK